MKKLKCPQCGTIFTIDEEDYTQILKQVRTEEFEQELNNRIAAHNALIEAERKAERARNEKEIERRKNEQNLELNKRDNEIERLKEQIASIAKSKELELREELSNKEQKMRNELNNKDIEIAKLKESLAKVDTTIELEVLKERSKADKEIHERDEQIGALRSIVQREKNEANIRENNLREQHKAEIKAAQEQIEFYRDYKAKLSTKMLGETLEEHCSIEYERSLRPYLPNAYFKKDNEVTDGTKGDFVYRDYAEGVEYISIMFEMKNEADTTTSKHKNSEFLKKLDDDRRKKGCEYAVLVSLLEPDSELYNAGIVDVSHIYEKMYIIRPQFFVPIITLLTQAAKKNIEYKQELEIARRQSIDVTNFENELKEFKSKFTDSCRKANDRFHDAIAAIDASIKKLEETKKALLVSEGHLNAAENHSNGLTIRKLTRKNPTMKQKFLEARELNTVTYEVLED